MDGFARLFALDLFFASVKAPPQPARAYSSALMTATAGRCADTLNARSISEFGPSAEGSYGAVGLSLSAPYAPARTIAVDYRHPTLLSLRANPRQCVAQAVVITSRV